ncbi:MAG: S-layer homology domain-containing protein, partial [Promicromonosporaceae bacterium]|nr:S-layer homology domain-containing protein [Promicromonosporaceae bacterium]
LRATEAHIFNNFFDHAGQGPAAGERASVIMEGNVFIETGTGQSYNAGRGLQAPMGVSGQGFGGGMAGNEGPGLIISAAMPHEDGVIEGFYGLNPANLTELEIDTGRIGAFGDPAAFIADLVPNVMDAATSARFNPVADNAIRALPRGGSGTTTQTNNNAAMRNIGNISGGNNFDTHRYIFQPFNPALITPGYVDVMNPEVDDVEQYVRNNSGAQRETGTLPVPETLNPETHIQRPIISWLNINSNGSFTIRTARSPWATGYIWEWDQGDGDWTQITGGPGVGDAYTFTTSPAVAAATPGGTYQFRVTALNGRTGESMTSEIVGITAFVPNPTEANLINTEELTNAIFSENFDDAPLGAIRSSDLIAGMNLDVRRFPYQTSGIGFNPDHVAAGVTADDGYNPPNDRLMNALFPDVRRNDVIITDAENALLDATFHGEDPTIAATIAAIADVEFDGNALLLRDWNWNNQADQERYATFATFDLGENVGGVVSISYEFLLNRSQAQVGADIFPIQLHDENERLIMARRANTSPAHLHHFDPGLSLDQPTWQDNTNRWIAIEVVLDFDNGVFDVYLDGEVYEYGVRIPRGITGVRYVTANTSTGNHASATMNLLLDNVLVMAGEEDPGEHTESPFIDVALDSPFFDDIYWMALNGISTGWETEAGPEFRPGNNVTREAMAAFLFRAALEPVFEVPREPTFVDVPVGSPFFAPIEWLVSQEITTGWDMPDGTREFRPGAYITREAMVAFLFRAADVDGFVPPRESPFVDVAVGSVFFTEIAWAAEVGIARGWDDGTFRPGLNVTREATAAWLHRASVVGGGIWTDTDDGEHIESAWFAPHDDELVYPEYYEVAG